MTVLDSPSIQNCFGMKNQNYKIQRIVQFKHLGGALKHGIYPNDLVWRKIQQLVHMSYLLINKINLFNMN